MFYSLSEKASPTSLGGGRMRPSHLEQGLAMVRPQQVVAPWRDEGQVGSLHFGGVAVGEQMTQISHLDNKEILKTSTISLGERSWKMSVVRNRLLLTGLCNMGLGGGVGSLRREAEERARSCRLSPGGPEPWGQLSTFSASVFAVPVSPAEDEDAVSPMTHFILPHFPEPFEDSHRQTRVLI